MGLKVSYFKNLLICTHRGNYRGIVSNAKPFFLLAIIQSIEDGIIVGNKISFDNEKLISVYNTISRKYELNKQPTPFNKPFFHLNREEYYFLKWKHGIHVPKQCVSPSSKFLRENVEFAALDDELWDLLQIPETREELKSTIIKFFLS